MGRVALWAGLLLLLTNAIMLSRLAAGTVPLERMQPSMQYFVTLQLSADLHGEPAVIKAFLPSTGATQTLSSEKVESRRLSYSLLPEGENRLGVWRGEDIEGHEVAVYASLVDVHPRIFELPERVPITATLPDEVARYLEPSETIQSDAHAIRARVEQLLPADAAEDAAETIRALFEFTRDEIAGSDYENTLDAVTTLRWGEAFCGGKSRLLAALLRASGIPARLVGGLILTPGSKRTTHVWVEAWLNGEWIPLDALNDHFARHPANYLVLYYGDENLFSRTKNINFQYTFAVKKWRRPPDEALASGGGLLNPFVFWESFREAHISLNLLRIILLLPVGVLVVIFFRNVVGLTTFGTFHPALMAVAFRDTGLVWGVGLYLSVLLLGMGLRELLDRLQILHTPRLAIVLVFVVAFMLGASFFGVRFGAVEAAQLSMFPIAILTITVESLFTKAVELGRRQAFAVVLQTLLVITCVFLVMESHLVQALVFGFPEVLLAVAASYLVIGRWLGMRLSEYRRFRWLLVS